MVDAPWDFDWVTARSKCSLPDMFGTLMAEARTNMLTRNEILDDSGDRGRFKWKERTTPATSFTIYDSWGRQRRAVDVTLTADAIEITRTINDSTGAPIRLTVTLTDAGQCRFKSGPDEELEVWQVLKRSLEELFFGA